MNNEIIFVGIIVMAALAGCATYPNASEHEVHYSGQIGVTDGRFYMDGKVYISKGTAPDVSFSKTQMVLYDNRSEKIGEITIGDLSTDPETAPIEREVNFTGEHIPTYVILESPDFWHDNDIPTEAFERTDDGYNSYFITDSEEKFEG